MNIQVNENSAIPVYEQIVIQVYRGVLDGALSPGDSLPAIRQLAKDLDLTANTVAKAFQILERSRIVSTGGRRGTFIHDNARDHAERFVKEQVTRQVKEFVAHQLRYGIGKADLEELISQAIRQS